MNYKDYIEREVGALIKAKDENINLKVYENANANFEGGINDCTIVINGLGGSTDSDDIEVVPIQLMVLTGGQYQENANGETAYDIVYEALKEFCKNNNGKSVILNDFDYYKQSYVQPFPINPLESDAGTFRMNFVVSGTITISRNINDIVEIKVNGQTIPFLNVKVAYATSQNASNIYGKSLSRNMIQLSSLTIQLEVYNRNNKLGNMMRSLRNEQIPSNTPISVELLFNDKTVETHRCIITEAIVSCDKINPSVSSYTLSLY